MLLPLIFCLLTAPEETSKDPTITRAGTVSVGIDGVFGFEWVRADFDSVFLETENLPYSDNDRGFYLANADTPFAPRTLLTVDYTIGSGFTAGVRGGYSRRSNRDENRTAFRWGGRLGYAIPLGSVALWGNIGFGHFRSQTRPDLEGAAVSEIVQGLQLTTDIDAVIPLSELVSVVLGVTAWQSFDGKNFDYAIDALSASADAGLLLTF
ncbi:MAG: hypothetical protein AAFP04_12565 [Myxococcota bacterium]